MRRWRGVICALALTVAVAAEARPAGPPRGSCLAPQKPAAALPSGARGTLPAVEAARLQAEFNRGAGKVRLVAILSPTCPYCRHGQSVVAQLLRQFPTRRLQALIVWLPMLAPDDAGRAAAQSRKATDPRIVQGWDAEQQTGKLFARALGLRGIAWDVYLLYPSGVKWEGALPPKPDFWMHQLSPDSGADQALCLNPDRLAAELKKLLAEGDR